MHWAFRSHALAGLLMGLLSTRAAADQTADALIAELKSGRATLDQVLPWLDTDHPDLQRTLLEAAVNHPEWGPAAAKQLEKWLAEPEFSGARERGLTGLLQTFGQNEEVQAGLVRVFASPGGTRWQRLQLLQCLARLRLDPLPAAWLDLLERQLASEDELTCREAIFAARATDLRRFDSILRAIGNNEKVAPDTRVAAVECLGPRRQGDAALFRFLRQQMTTKRSHLRSVAAARALGASRLSEAQLLDLCSDFDKIPPATISLLLPTFARSRHPKVGAALIQGLGRVSAVPLTVGELDRTLSAYQTEVHLQVQPLRKAIRGRDQLEWDNLARVSRELPAGDARRGQAVFQSEKAQCTTCHRASGTGGALGPNLSRIGVIRTHDQLLESILFPDAYVAPEFRTYVVTTTAGAAHTGLWLQETTDALYLRTGPITRIKIARGAIEECAPVRKSLMPEGLDQLLSRQELSDLVEFLATRR